PYQCLWTNVAAGTYTISAIATNNYGATASALVTNIILNAMPAVTIKTPTNLQTYLEITNVLLSAIASDPDGTISQVKFYWRSNLLGTATLSGTNYNLTWSNRLAGIYPITAEATDNRGATAAS